VKIFQVNFLTLLLVLAFLLLFVLLPSFFIQSLWNSFFEESLSRDLIINLWQASLLWGAVLTVVYMTGIFKFKIDFRSLENIDLDSIDDPMLRDEIEKLRSLSKKKKQGKILKQENEKTSNQDKVE
jgi:uncharacterized membrane protein (DUF485 family)